MTIKNSEQNYGSIAKLLHWSSAAIFLLSYLSVYYRHWLTDEGTTANWNALQIHLSVGLTMTVVLILRVYWRLSSPTPSAEPGTKLEHFAAKLGHSLLYLTMIIMPLTGYIGTSVDTDLFLLFEVPMFESTHIFSLLNDIWPSLTFIQIEQPIDIVHKIIMGQYIVPLLTAGHIAAALYHHFVRKDRTLSKMLPARQTV